MIYHPFHIVEKRPWPFTSCVTSIIITISTIFALHFSFTYIILLALTILILTLFQWWRDVSREASLQGNHSSFVIWGLKMGIILFIISEIFFYLFSELSFIEDYLLILKLAPNDHPKILFHSTRLKFPS